MMEFERYSPRHSPGGSVHMLSPTHVHTTTIDGFPSIGQIRNSLSRSPSKPARYSLNSGKPSGTSSSVPLSPSSLSRAFVSDNTASALPRSSHSGRRSSHVRNASRRTSPTSPLRRALSDNTNQINANPRITRNSSSDGEQENMDCSADSTRTTNAARFDDPIKIDFLKPDKLLQPVKREHTSPLKSSPLKRSDGVMNLEAASFGSPRNKRRSLHGASLGSDFNVFDQGLDGTQSDSADSSEEKDTQGGGATCAATAASSPQRRPFSLRKSTLQQRAGPGRSRLFTDAARDMNLSPALTRARSRISLDSALPLRSFDLECFRNANASDPPVLFPPPAQKPYQSAPKPHPLSQTLTPSNSSLRENQGQTAFDRRPPSFQKPEVPQLRPQLTTSLPIGAMRPSLTTDDGPQASSHESFATPAGYKMAKPFPQAFMSTGLISKRNRNLDMAPASPFPSANMPDTPSKKTHILIASSPAPPSALGKVARPTHEFGSPSTPFNGRTSKISPEAFGKGVSIFGSRVGAPQLTRRGSFLSLDGEDLSNSPSNPAESQSSNDDLPPTPTKSTSITTRPQSKGKSNSLRSSLFGRRTSLAPDTFDAHTPPEDHDIPTATNSFVAAEKHSPRTPSESYAPPDPSNLSISIDFSRPTSRRHTVYGFPPATPTGPRDSGFSTSLAPGHNSSSYFSNDVDTALTSRFAQVTSLGIGEFSQVYRVEKPLTRRPSALHESKPADRTVWAVKKSRKPYTGNKDRERKMREVRVLKALRGHEHLIEVVAEWESKNHLYIQTEFCENGNLKDFLLQTGFKGRLDDFRIWKILLELSQGVKSIHDANFIHLDLKPANVFIDWEGVLKIGDFGMASPWPAPVGLDGEGDREYIGPEVLAGHFDKSADIFSLGMVMLEIAGNIVLPDNGTSWQRLRAGDMSDLPSLTWSSDSSLVRDESGEPIDNPSSNESLCASHDAGDDDDDDELAFLRPSSAVHTSTAKALEQRTQDLVIPPNFMVDSADPEALDRVVQWMISPDPRRRPVIDQLLAAGGVQWVDHRRRAGATIYEGTWGPADSVLSSYRGDVEMMDI